MNAPAKTSGVSLSCKLGMAITSTPITKLVHKVFDKYHFFDCCSIGSPFCYLGPWHIKVKCKFDGVLSFVVAITSCEDVAV